MHSSHPASVSSARAVKHAVEYLLSCQISLLLPQSVQPLPTLSAPSNELRILSLSSATNTRVVVPKQGCFSSLAPLPYCYDRPNHGAIATGRRLHLATHWPSKQFTSLLWRPTRCEHPSPRAGVTGSTYCSHGLNAPNRSASRIAVFKDAPFLTLCCASHQAIARCLVGLG